MTIVLDVGSGASLPDRSSCEQVVEVVASSNSRRHRVILKPQLFRDQPPNKPLQHYLFEYLSDLVEQADLGLAASVFDMPSMGLALAFNITHVKVACRPDLYWLTGKVPREIPVHVSYDCRWHAPDSLPPKTDVPLACVPEYPAKAEDYVVEPWGSVSDHTIGFQMCTPDREFVEKHFVLSRGGDNPDAGPFALIPEDLGRIL